MATSSPSLLPTSSPLTSLSFNLPPELKSPIRLLGRDESFSLFSSPSSSVSCDDEETTLLPTQDDTFRQLFTGNEDDDNNNNDDGYKDDNNNDNRFKDDNARTASQTALAAGVGRPPDRDDDSNDDDEDDDAAAVDLPSTQTFRANLDRLRRPGAKAPPPLLRPTTIPISQNSDNNNHNNTDDDADTSEIAETNRVSDLDILRRRIDELEEDNRALRLQLDEFRRDIAPLLQQKPSQQQQQQQQQQQSNFITAQSKAKKKKKSRESRAAAAAATAAAASSSDASSPDASSPAAAAPVTTAVSTFNFYVDSNLQDVTPDQIKTIINNINKNNRNNANNSNANNSNTNNTNNANNNNANNNANNINYDIKTNVTYELQQTCDKILHTEYKHDDTIIIATLTNDARQTRRRQPKTIEQTQRLQDKIITHLAKYVPLRNIVFCEAPPINGGDIYPYNRMTYNTCYRRGVRFGPTLVGETHMWRDGYHILNSRRHLLIKSVAAAAIGVHPHAHFQHARPPHGAFGPWVAPNGQGMSFAATAAAQPYYFRQRPSTHPFNNNIRGFR